MGTMKSLKSLVSSSYIRDLPMLGVAYRISINLVEVAWKSECKSQFLDRNECPSFVGDFSTTGIPTFTMMLLSQYAFIKCERGVAAKITPTVPLVTGVGFSSLILLGDPFILTLAKFGMIPLLAAIYVGAMQNVFSKSAKYSLLTPARKWRILP
ncbi:uncharacterized protein J3R85_020633 [Psidium guajava]|nr:uncharacterized protein J3R85_020633 [Psidium guajava]